MRALTSLLVLALAAPMPAFACGMVMREKSVNLAELMDEVETAKPEAAPLAEVDLQPAAQAVITAAVEPAPEPAVTKADAPQTAIPPQS